MKLAADPAWHPSADAVERFLGGECPRAEAMTIVRHALQGCPQCNRLARRLWERGLKKSPAAAAPVRRRPPGQVVSIAFHLKRRSPLEDQVNDARIQLLSIVGDLAAVKDRLLGVKGSLPAGIAETDPLLETDHTDEATEIRTAIGCVLNDYIDPAEVVLRIASAQMARDLDSERSEGDEGKGGA